MSRKPLSMRKIHEVARLKAAKLSIRQIAKSCGIARSTVCDYLRRLESAGLSWPLPRELSEEELDARLFRCSEIRERDTTRPVPDWTRIHKESHRKAVTLRLLWEEYQQTYADGYGYSQFCEHYRRWREPLDVCMRHVYVAGKWLFVDYAGMTMPVVGGGTGEARQAQIFVATLGASHYIYAEATWSQQLPDWIASHIRTYEHLGGVTEITSPDNLKSGVTKPCWYDPQMNRTYSDMGEHYDTAVMARRPKQPRDGAKVESGVQIIERQVLARLRDQTFFSLAELNGAVRELTEGVNKRPFQKLDVSRLELFMELDKPALKSLPARRYEYAEFPKPKTVNIDYHIDVQGHYYSVPYTLKGQKVEVRLTRQVVEVLHKLRRVTSHVRDDRKGGYSTKLEHMPKSHREHMAWTPSRIMRWADKTGPKCLACAERILNDRRHPEQGYRACLGVMRLSKDYGPQRLEAACSRALTLEVCTYQSIKSILKTNKDREDVPAQTAPRSRQVRHQNVRGSEYYAGDYGNTQLELPGWDDGQGKGGV